MKGQHIRYIASLLLLLVVWSCGEDENGGAGDNGEPVSDAGADTDADSRSDTPSDTDTSAPDTTVDVAPDVESDLAQDEGGNNNPGGCTDNRDCEEHTSYCNFPVGACGDPEGGGICEDRPAACPGDFDPVCGCDGVTYQNNCQRAGAGIPMDHDGQCDGDPISCGGEGEGCPEFSFCECIAACGQEGFCRPLPEGCDDDYQPVCGCDGQTYSNDCERQTARVCLDYEEECGPDICGGMQGLECDDGFVCDLLAGGCQGMELPGICVERPQDCGGLPEQLVCGCDGVTYRNNCERLQAGVQKDRDGECPARPCNNNAACTPRQFCEVPVGECRGDAVGICTVVPAECPDDQDPVCGCNGQTYPNDCYRMIARVGKARDGACVSEVQCGGERQIPCNGRDEFCDKYSCVLPDAGGVCETVPRVCPRPPVGSDVCGCDGVTYASDCFRIQARVSRISEFPCQLCSRRNLCVLNVDFCEYPPGVCNDLNAVGACIFKPETCRRDRDPVCGCNGRTYQNDCERRRAGVALDYTGSCR